MDLVSTEEGIQLTHAGKIAGLFERGSPAEHLVLAPQAFLRPQE